MQVKGDRTTAVFKQMTMNWHEPTGISQLLSLLLCRPELNFADRLRSKIFLFRPVVPRPLPVEFDIDICWPVKQRVLPVELTIPMFVDETTAVTSDVNSTASKTVVKIARRTLTIPVFVDKTTAVTRYVDEMATFT